MTDKELLTLAAKAAGIDTTRCLQYANGAFDWSGKESGSWNPLTDDGDALRLAVKCLHFHTLQYSAEDWEYCNQDGYAATRRAIVRAAAEIGKGML